MTAAAALATALLAAALLAAALLAASVAQASAPVKGATYTGKKGNSKEYEFKVSARGTQVSGFDYTYETTCVTPVVMFFASTAHISHGSFTVKAVRSNSFADAVAVGISGVITMHFGPHGLATGKLALTRPSQCTIGGRRGGPSTQSTATLTAHTTKGESPPGGAGGAVPNAFGDQCGTVGLAGLASKPNHHTIAIFIEPTAISCAVARAAIEAGAFAGPGSAESVTTAGWVCVTPPPSNFSCTRASPSARFTFVVQ